MKKLSMRNLLIIVLVIDIILCGAFILIKVINNKKPADRQISESSIRRICELATLDCFYHNVSEWHDPGDFFNAGKKLWMEYDGVVRVGIDGNLVKVSDPDADGVITVTIPQAVVLGKDLDEKSIYEIDSGSPLWGFIPIYGSVSTEERKKALAAAQEDMAASAANNEMVLDEARVRAMKTIEKNIMELGESAGKNYKIRFADADLAEQTDFSKKQTAPLDNQLVSQEERVAQTEDDKAQ